MALVSLILYLEVTKDVNKEIIDGPADASVWSPGENDELDSQQRDEDEGGSHCLHVGRALGAVGFFQLGDQDPDDVQEEEKVHLGEGSESRKRRDRDKTCMFLIYSKGKHIFAQHLRSYNNWPDGGSVTTPSHNEFKDPGSPLFLFICMAFIYLFILMFV